jgi:hypothetical protein
MCYRIEPKPVREGNKKMKRGKERERERKHAQFTGE